MNLTFQVEQWSACLPELRPLFTELWEDVAVDQDRFTAKCDEEKYAALEKLDMLCLVTARFEQKLVGFYLVFITPNGHYFGAGPMAFTDQYFLLEEFRKGNTGLRMFSFAEKAWREKGCVKAYTSHKLHHDRSAMLKVLGWKATDVVYSKVLY